MEIVIRRSSSVQGTTIGEMSINGKLICFTLEDQIRVNEPKVFGETCIPAGKYSVVVTFSPHFNRDLPLLVDVPGFEGVRIHPGNTKADTEGCILVGTQVSTNKQMIYESKLAFDRLFKQIQAAIAANEPVTVELINPQYDQPTKE